MHRGRPSVPVTGPASPVPWHLPAQHGLDSLAALRGVSSTFCLLFPPPIEPPSCPLDHFVGDGLGFGRTQSA